MKAESFSISSRIYPNEDRLIVRKIGDSCITAVLADGMGGLSLGHLAADVVTKSVTDFLIVHYQGCDEQVILHKALDYADQELRKVSIRKRSNMGTAVAVAIVTGRHLYYTWQVGCKI